MSDDNKAVLELSEAGRNDDDVRYYQVDETDVGEAARSRTLDADEAQRRKAGG